MNYNYKNEIISSRVGSIGGSDAKMLSAIESNGYVPKSAYKRLAVCKGLIEPDEGIKTRAMAFGDYIENCIYEHLLLKNDKFKSNPILCSKKFSRNNVKLICHPDFYFENEEEKTIYVYECKATKFNFNETRQTYKEQLFVEHELAKERATELGRGWKVKMFLVHYNTDGIDLEEDFSFDTDRLSVNRITSGAKVFDIGRSMDIVSKFLEDFNEYYEDEEIDAELLPAQVKTQFDAISNVLREIKEREKVVDDFKKRLYEFLKERGIKKVSCDDFSFTVVDDSESVSVDYKKLFETEILERKPRVGYKLKEKYKKVTKRKGYVMIKVNDKNNIN